MCLCLDQQGHRTDTMKLLFVLLCIAMLVGCVVAVPVTQPIVAGDITTNRVYFHRAGLGTAPCWYSWGVGTNYYWTTPNQSVCTLSDYQDGSPMLTGQSYNVRACDATGCDLTPEAWTVPQAAMVPISHLGDGFMTIQRSGFNVTQASGMIILPYTSALMDVTKTTSENAQALIVGVLFFFIYVGYWLRGAGIGTPAILSIISFGYIFGTTGGVNGIGWGVPPPFQILGYLLLVVGVTGWLYSWTSNK